MILARTYLIFVAILYLGLALWCTASPQVTSNKVGLELKGGAGNSEFMTVYGGLEFGIALALCYCSIRSQSVYDGLVICTLMHGALVLFRTLSFLRYAEISNMIYRLAIGEWIIFLAGVGLLIYFRQQFSRLN